MGKTVRRLFTAAEAAERGVTRSALRWGVRAGKWRPVERGVYIVGADEPSVVERAVAVVIATGGIASGRLAAVLLELDSVTVRTPDVTVPPRQSGRRSGVRRRTLPSERVITVDGVPSTDGLQTLLDLAPLLDDERWEHALESALRKRLTTVAAIEGALESKVKAASRVRRVLSARPTGAPPTESLLETLMVQLARRVPGLPDPVRQLVIRNDDGVFVARVDLAWPQLGIFIELDGEHHNGQPMYDASRETAVVATTGWLCGRFTWTEVVHHQQHTIRRLGQLAAQGRRRPIPA